MIIMKRRVNNDYVEISSSRMIHKADTLREREATTSSVANRSC